MKLQETVFVKYKYAIEMAPIQLEYGEWIKKMIKNTKINEILNNTSSLLLSPIIRTEHDKYNFLNLVLDFDTDKTDSSSIKRLMNIVQSIVVKNEKCLRVFFSGKNGYHVRFNKLIRYPSSMSLKDLKLKVSSVIPYTMIDFDTSIKDNPIYELGHRTETDLCGVEIFDKFDIKKTEKYKVHNMRKYMSSTDLKNIIRTLIPKEFIDIAEFTNGVIK